MVRASSENHCELQAAMQDVDSKSYEEDACIGSENE